MNIVNYTMSCIHQNNNKNLSTEEYLKLQGQIEDQIDYQFIQRIIKEVKQKLILNVINVIIFFLLLPIVY